MTVTIHLVNKQYIEIEATHDAEGIWERIKRGEPIKTGRWDDKVIVNPDNVTTVRTGPR